MAIITLRIPDELKSTMDKLDEINWSAVTRNFLQKRVQEEFIKERIAKAEREIEEGNYFTQEEVERMFLEEEKNEI